MVPTHDWNGGGGGGGSVLLDIINVMKSSNGSAGGGKSQQQLGLDAVWESIEPLPPIEQLEFLSRTKTLHEYELLQALGTGEFAEVQACRARADGKAASPVFAIKHISKAHIVSVSNMKHTLRRIKRVGTEIAAMRILSSTCVSRSPLERRLEHDRGQRRRDAWAARSCARANRDIARSSSFRLRFTWSCSYLLTATVPASCCARFPRPSVALWAWLRG